MEPRIIAGVALLSLAAGQCYAVAATTVDTTCTGIFETCHPADEPSPHHPYPGPNTDIATTGTASSSTPLIWDEGRWDEGVWG
jgi:hypothetical protein